jgi:hypothetical protein
MTKFVRQLTPQMGSGLIIKQQKFTFVLERLVYKHEFEVEGIPQFGLVAEQVQKVI